CRECGSHMRSAPSHGRPYYRCANRDGLSRTHCQMGVVVATDLYERVRDEVFHCVDEPDALYVRLRLEQRRLSKNLQPELDQLVLALNRLDRKEHNLLNLLADDDLSSLESVKAELKQAQSEKQRLQDEKQRLLALAEHQQRVIQNSQALDQHIKAIRKRLRRGLRFEDEV